MARRATTLSLTETAKRIGISISTVRNWIRAGVLQLSADKGVEVSSIERCEREQLGQQRLVSRANKRHKREAEGDKKIRGNYDESLSESHRNREGVYYTPQSVVRDMLQCAVGSCDGESLSDKMLLDPCCGSGNFLVEALAMGFRPENIFGYDIDPEAVRIARKRVYELTGVRVTKNIVCGDFLRIACSSHRHYDYVVTNPPWGKKMEVAERRELSRIYGLERSADSSSLFLVAAMGVLREGGRLNFLVQEALFSVRAYESVRRYLFDYDVDTLVDYGRAFSSLMTSAISVALTKTAPSCSSQISCRVGKKSYFRSRESFTCNPYLIFNLWATPTEAEVVERLLQREHITLRGRAQWGLGVVTGANDRYLSTEPKAGYVEVVRGADIEPESRERFGQGAIKRGSLYLKDDLSNYQQVAPLHIYHSPEKLIYRFISNRLAFAVDREQLITLNSANILIIDREFPLSAEQLARLLNSDFMNFVFRTIFHTRKVLRGDLEWLPIYPEYFAQSSEFDENEYRKWLNVEISD